MGGYICLEIMRQAPDRVIKLALLSTSARPDTPQQIAQRRALVAQARDGHFRALLEQILPKILHPSRQGDRRLVDMHVNMGLTVGVEGFARQQKAIIARSDDRPDLALISIPTLVLVGDSDPLMPPDFSRELAAAIAGACFVMVSQCGHASTLEQPEAVNQALIKWIMA